MKNQRSGITLMELIIVLGMVSVLLAIALPAMRAVHAASLKRRAAAEATELAQGALRYKETYGFWPGEVKLVSDADTKVKLHEDTPQQNGLKRAALIVSAPGVERPVRVEYAGGHLGEPDRTQHRHGTLVETQDE